LSWNIEIACVRGAGVEPDDAVPDVFGPTETWFGWEDASSVSRDPDLCVAHINDWIVVIDVGCRLTESEDYVEEASAGRELHVVRIADAPVHVHYRDGEKLAERRGVRDCAAVLKGEAAKQNDGEQIAWSLLKAQTGLDLMGALFDAKYQLFVLF
jgi:hypothetical protein